jgi:hypothetical protein
LGHAVPGGYKYRDLALQVGGVSNEIVKYGREFCGTLKQRVTALARPRSNCTVKYKPVLSSERALQNNKHATVLKEISRRKENWSRVPDGRLTPRQTGRLTVARKLTSTSTVVSVPSEPMYLKASSMLLNTEQIHILVLSLRFLRY